MTTIRFFNDNDIFLNLKSSFLIKKLYLTQTLNLTAKLLTIMVFSSNKQNQTLVNHNLNKQSNIISQ